MRTKLLVGSIFTLIVIGLIVPGIVSAEDKAAAPASPAAQPAAASESGAQTAGDKQAAPTPEQIMAALQKYGTPGPEHEKLKEMAGKWDAEVTFQMDPAAPPQTSKGTMTNEPILDGRFVSQEFKGDFMGSPFTGLGLLGFDKMKGKYTSYWTDSMSTAVVMAEGEADPSGKTITYSGTYDCPITQQKKTSRQVVTIQDKDHHTFEAFEKGPDGKEIKSMTIKYTRAK